MGDANGKFSRRGPMKMQTKYSSEEVIQLARMNPGFGFQRFVHHLYGARKRDGRRGDWILDALNVHKGETGEDLYEHLQNDEELERVTEAEYMEITGRNVPAGYGRRGASMGKKKNRASKHKYNLIPLPPKELEWGEIPPYDQRDPHLQRGFIDNEYRVLNLRFDFRGAWDLWGSGYTRIDISREMGYAERYRVVQKWINLMIRVFEDERLEEWFEVVEIVQWFSEDRGCRDYSEDRIDPIISFMHSITKDYILRPVESERPDPKELISIYRFACEEMRKEAD